MRLLRQGRWGAQIEADFDRYTYYPRRTCVVLSHRRGSQSGEDILACPKSDHPRSSSPGFGSARNVAHNIHAWQMYTLLLFPSRIRGHKVLFMCLSNVAESLAASGTACIDVCLAAVCSMTQVKSVELRRT